MIEEEKRAYSPSYKEDASVASEEITNETSSASEVNLSGGVNSDFQSTQNSTDETSAELNSTQAEEENQSPVVTEATERSADLGDTTSLESLRREVESLKAQLEERTNQCESFKTQYVRIAADFDNFRKRTSKEKEELETQIKCSTISELLSVVDNFDRARSQIKPQTDGEMTIHKSYQSVYKQLVDSLKRIGVSPMRAEGKEFDPALHEAVMRQSTHEYPEGTVIEELVRGYFLGDRVLRHAMVKVAAAAEAVVTSEESHPDISES
jgi:molecular chaperone GrpE